MARTSAMRPCRRRPPRSRSFSRSSSSGLYTVTLGPVAGRMACVFSFISSSSLLPLCSSSLRFAFRSPCSLSMYSLLSALFVDSELSRNSPPGGADCYRSVPVVAFRCSGSMSFRCSSSPAISTTAPDAASYLTESQALQVLSTLLHLPAIPYLQFGQYAGSDIVLSSNMPLFCRRRLNESRVVAADRPPAGTSFYASGR